MLNMFHNLPALAGAAGITLFVLPVFTGRIINIGNVTGFSVCLCLLGGWILRRQVFSLCARLWRQGLPARVLLTGAAAMLTMVALTALILTAMMVRAALRPPASGAPVIVLGCEVKGDRPSRMLKGRMDAAIDHLRKNPAGVCVVSGGKGENELISEAECMYRYMTAAGISPDRILCEDRSTSTRENLLFSARILRGKGISTEGGIAVVTNEFHACRAGLIAGKLGIRTGSVCSRSPWWLLPTFYVRELYGLLYQIFL